MLVGTATETVAVNHSPGVSSPSPRLVKAAHEFEAQMMKELLRPLSETGEDGEDGNFGPLGDFASESLGRGLSSQGGFGMASRILHELSHAGNVAGQAAGVGNSGSPERNKLD